MKKALIGAVVGAFILFIWQTFSWTVSGIHDRAFKYTPNQDALISELSKQLPAEGQYLLPRAAPGA